MADSRWRSRLRRVGGAAGILICALALPAALAQPAPAHQLGPNYETVVRSVTPEAPGLGARVVEREGELRLTNRSKARVTVEGYDEEPYLRFDAGGSVYVNVRSPAHYLNRDIYARSDVPPTADPGAIPRWQRIAVDGTYAWHDHRIHWMSPQPPESVADARQRTKVFDWNVPIAIDERAGHIAGSLYWLPESKASPLASILVFTICAIVVLTGAVIWLRRSRGDDEREAW